jgi:hypothetical protein
VDFLPALSARAGEDIFYRADHHWTTLGAYYGYAGPSRYYRVYLSRVVRFHVVYYQVVEIATCENVGYSFHEAAVRSALHGV